MFLLANLHHSWLANVSARSSLRRVLPSAVRLGRDRCRILPLGGIRHLFPIPGNGFELSTGLRADGIEIRNLADFGGVLPVPPNELCLGHRHGGALLNVRSRFIAEPRRESVQFGTQPLARS